MSVEQLALLEPAPSHLRMSRDGWICKPLAVGGRYWHPNIPGVQIEHCGHPTAHRPYCVIGPNSTIAQKFYDLAKAKAAVVEEWRSRS